jgi:hypothetical protein
LALLLGPIRAERYWNREAAAANALRPEDRLLGSGRASLSIRNDALSIVPVAGAIPSLTIPFRPLVPGMRFGSVRIIHSRAVVSFTVPSGRIPI